MNPLTLEWIDKAEGDFATASREMRVRKLPNYDAVCFHAQQTAEKYLKAVQQENRRPIPKTHSLLELLALIIEFEPVYLMLQPDLNVLEGYAVQYRYPGQAAEKLDARAALLAARRVRGFIRTKLRLN
jgi:HEPN domain-containing protein